VVTTASAHKAKGKLVNMQRAVVIMVSLYRSATPFDSCEYAGEWSCIISYVTNQPSVKVFVTGNDYLTIIGYRHSLRSLLRLSL